MKALLRVFRLDLRSLALSRILLGLVIVIDFLFAICRRHQYYTEQSVLPRSYIPQIDSMEHTFSLYLAVAWPGFTIFLLCLSVLLALSFTVGYKTRLTSVLVWLAVVFLQERNRMVLIGGDAWLRVTLFWFMFLPIGEYFSLDSAKSGKKQPGQTVANAASFGFMMQVVFIYLWAGVAKFGDDWWQGKAIYFVLQGHEFGYGLANYALYFPDILSAVSMSIPYLEIAAGLSLIVPLKNARFRTFGVASMICMHAGIWLTMELYHFSAIAIFTLVSLSPSYIWGGKDKLGDFHLQKSLSVFMIALTVATWVYNPYRLYKKGDVKRNLHLVAEFMGVQQLWQLFAPTAPRSSFIIYAVAELEDGSQQPLSYWGNKRERAPGPDDVEFEVRLSRYWRSLTESQKQALAFQYHAAWFASQWNRLYPDEAADLKAIRLYYQSYKVVEHYEDVPPDAPTLIAYYQVPR